MRPAWLLAALVFASTTSAAPLAKPALAPKVLGTVEGISEYQLDNGLRVLLFPDASRPILTVNLTCLVGSRHEGYGESGMAHLLEHMLFRATRRYPNMDKLYEQRGGYSNGSTTWDRTNYFVSLPSKGDNLALAIDVAIDQLGGALLRKEDLDQEFSVVRNEFEMGENNPESVLFERILSTAYLWHNYGKSPIGSRADIERVPIERLRAFYERFYRPDNALLIITGKFDPKEALRLAALGAKRLPRPKQPLPKTYTVEPVQDGERSVVLERAGDLGFVGVALHTVSGTDPRMPAALVLTDVLGQKPWGRLYKNLVDANLATEVMPQAQPLHEPGFLALLAKLRKDQSLDRASEVLRATLDQLKQKPVTEEEVARSRAHWDKLIELQLANPEQVGEFLSDFAALGDWRMLFVLRDRLQKVTAAEVQAFANDFAKPSNRTYGMFRPTANPDRAPLPAEPDPRKALADWRPQAGQQAGEAFEATVDNIEKRTLRATLDGGMKIELLSKRSRGGLVTGAIELRYGNEESLRGKVPAAILVGPMLLRGTRTLSYQQLRERLDQLKAELVVSGDVPEGEQPAPSPKPDAVLLQFQTKREHLPALLDLLAEILQQPSFPPAEYETLRRGLIAHYEAARLDPTRLAQLELLRRINPIPPTSLHYRPSFTEHIDWLQKTSLDQVKQVYQDSFGSSGMNVALVGDFDTAAVKAQLERRFSGWRSKQPFVRVPVPLAPATPGKLRLRIHEKQSATIASGLALPMRDDHEDFPALDLASYVLGRGFNSRLIARLRTQEGISYSTFAALHSEAQDAVATFLTMAMAANPKALRAAEILEEEITRWAQQGITPTELEEFKRSYAETFHADLARDENVVQLLYSTAYEKRTLTYYSELQRRVAALTLDQINATLRRRIDPKRCVEIIAGDVP